ncbi:formylglycine-generating enzyme required for sulfatase activity [Curtobacterium sp. PhB130]|uniref:SUMF1/EgtB/PvdO family nonheme iron enzyme n=1 Tax=Curtobacterium sp. PhB130 TaxID=2485178 RepID=UPI000F4BBF5B|nr:SUMF1/EgtB/PvdO family nonheme iron enzyme [Curtobacterium sp. PhB130]ROS73845.1 formylglycine-generating enzyme required for sulfatase activity [Curtobacterium sp. PhB130]
MDTRVEVVDVAGGAFLMGSDRFYPDEGPVHQRTVAAFRIGSHPATNAEFAAFVDATGWVTDAERPLSSEDFPGLAPDERRAGSLVFTPTAGPVDLRDWRAWWRWQAGADWRHPRGPESSVGGLDDHPVVQVSHADAAAYAAWVGGRLPTEAEWEYAAKAGGEPDWPFAWGTDAHPGGATMANTWQGAFPYRNTGAAGWVGTSPVGSFPPNPLGIVDMIGNVWEWTDTPYTARHEPGTATGGEHCGCGPADAHHGMTADGSAAEPAMRVLKGGSHLCAPEYCLRYRPAARSPQSDDSAATHIGFRVAWDA